MDDTNGKDEPERAVHPGPPPIEMGGAEYLDPPDETTSSPEAQEAVRQEVALRHEESLGLSRRLVGIRAWGPPAAGGLFVGLLIGFALWGRRSA